MQKTIDAVPTALLVGCLLDKREKKSHRASLDELARLVHTLGVEVLGIQSQNRDTFHPATLVGRGFLHDILAEYPQVDNVMLIFDHELTPVQKRNISDEFSLEVLDRTEVILQIFHRHAHTKEAQLQVRLAELKFQLPRLRMNSSQLDRVSTAGSGSGGFATRGSGETLLEKDRRRIHQEINKIESILDRIEQQNISRRKKRSRMKKICLVGYTNAGKSTLFNELTHAGVQVEDKLFATLDSTARAVNLGIGKDIILSDTVGFISQLPHELIASFRATLMDVRDAELLLHVIDITDPLLRQHIDDVNDVLASIGARSVPKIHVFNKIDSMENTPELLAFLSKDFPRYCAISARTGEHVSQLLAEIETVLFQRKRYCFFIPHNDAKALHHLHEQGEIIEKQYTTDGVNVLVELHKEDVRGYEKFLCDCPQKK